MEGLKELIRPPFANYDVVVYFGCGLFSLLLVYHYFIEPLGYRFPRFEFNIGISFADTAISTLSLLFSVYVLGHIIAYVGSVLIEKTIDSFFGKVSSAILISGASGRGRRSEIINAWLYDRARRSFRTGKKVQSAVRLLFHAPVLPLYLCVIIFGGFDYYRSRVSWRILQIARNRMSALNLGSISLRSQWYKSLEHVVTNSQPVATARMYNYLVISGTFRSVSVLVLGCVLMEIYYAVHYMIDGHYSVKPLMHDGNAAGPHILTFFMLYVAFGFCIASYMKFSRRYAEEAIFAFALGQCAKSSAAPEKD